MGSVCRTSLDYFISLDGQNNACGTGSTYSSERPGGSSVMPRKRLRKELTEIQRKVLKIFDMLTKPYTLTRRT